MAEGLKEDAMINLIYVEEDVRQHPRTKQIIARFPKATVLTCQHHKEIFNPSAQNFRLQKKNPALILARQTGKFVHPIPPSYGIGGQNNFYFSHMLNCMYDCRYCFLQGMYPSAHYLLFVNYEDFQNEIEKQTLKNKDATWFFSGYDCDSLAMESVTGFAEHFFSFFRKRPQAWVELRTKSVATRVLLGSNPFSNAVIAFSFTPEELSKRIEIGVPTVDARIKAMNEVANHGWKIGLRIDPIIDCEDFEKRYSGLFTKVFNHLNIERLHSVSLGMFPLPQPFFKKMEKLLPEEPLMAGPYESQEGKVSFPSKIQEERIDFCKKLLLQYIDKKILFCC